LQLIAALSGRDLPEAAVAKKLPRPSESKLARVRANSIALMARKEGLRRITTRNGAPTQIDVFRSLIDKAPGRAAVQLAIAIYGAKNAKP
jgi:hypothetical protein